MPGIDKSYKDENISAAENNSDPMQNVDQFTNVVFQSVNKAVDDDNNERNQNEK
ncbi:hypothetical protein [Peribacillus saganii]|uniref:hypothetical protein n=1 Tax=Peribacillus saganii TaxID=2303992 RepID=UPI0013144CEF|nr:hypothetical protein [Peribacillus saganii]